MAARDRKAARGKKATARKRASPESASETNAIAHWIALGGFVLTGIVVVAGVSALAAVSGGYEPPGYERQARRVRAMTSRAEWLRMPTADDLEPRGIALCKAPAG